MLPGHVKAALFHFRSPVRRDAAQLSVVLRELEFWQRHDRVRRGGSVLADAIRDPSLHLQILHGIHEHFTGASGRRPPPSTPAARHLSSGPLPAMPRRSVSCVLSPQYRDKSRTDQGSCAESQPLGSPAWRDPPFSRRWEEPGCKVDESTPSCAQTLQMQGILQQDSMRNYKKSVVRRNRAQVLR